MESKTKFKDPGKRMLQLAVREAINSKLSITSSFKRDFDRKKQHRCKISERKEASKESLVTREMAEIYLSIEKEKAKKKTLKSVPEKNFSESLLSNENVDEEFYIPPPRYPNNFLISSNPDIFSENKTLFVENERNHLPAASMGGFEQNLSYLENKHRLVFDESHKFLSLPNLVSCGHLVSDSTEKTTEEENLQNCPIPIQELERNKRNYVSRSKPLSPKKNEENEYIYSLIDSLTSKKSTVKNIEGISSEQPINIAKDEESTFSSSSPLDKSLFYSQGACDVPRTYLNFKTNLCKKEENTVEQESANLTEKIDALLSSQNEISAAVLCEIFKIHAIIN